MSSLKIKKLKNEVSKMEAVYSKPSTSDKTKAILKKAIDKAKEDIAKLEGKSAPKATPKAEPKAAPKKASAAPKATKKAKKSLSALDKLKMKVKGKKYSAYSKSSTDLKRDADRAAKPIGKRKSASGNTYYEYRANRFDVKQPPKRYPKLADGGMMEKGGQFSGKDWYDIRSFDISTYGEQGAKEKADKYIERYVEYWKNTSTPVENKDLKIRKSQFGGIDYKGEYVVMRLLPKYAEGGMMAHGGKVYDYPLHPPSIKYLEEDDVWAVIWYEGDEKNEMYFDSEDAAEEFYHVPYKMYEEAISDNKYDDEEEEDEYADGGYMANGGNVSKSYEKIEGTDYELKIQVYYDKGGMNYFTSRPEARGYYLSVSPVQVDRRENNIIVESYAAFSGIRALILPVQRQSPKSEKQAEELAQKMITELKEQVTTNLKRKLGMMKEGGMMAKGGETEKPISYYKYETPKVTIYWKGKLQPLGMFKSAEEAYEVIKKLSDRYGDIKDYEIHTPDKRIKLADGGMMAKGGMVDYSKNGYVKAIRDVDGKLLKEVKIGDDIYKYNSVYKTYNSIKNNELLHRSKYADGGMMADEGVDLFEDYENIPENVQEILDEHMEELDGGDYRDLEKVKEKLEAIGYTYEYGLDGVAYDLRKIGQKGKSETEDDEYASGGYMAKGGALDSVIDNIVSNALKQIDKAENSAEDFEYLLNGVIRKLQGFSKKADGGMMEKGGFNAAFKKMMDKVTNYDVIVQGQTQKQSTGWMGSNILSINVKAENEKEAEKIGKTQFLIKYPNDKIKRVSVNPDLSASIPALQGNYADGGMMAKGGNVRSLLKSFNEEKPSIALIMIADDVSSEFMRNRFDKTIKWDELSDDEKQKYNQDYRVNKDKFENYLMYEFVKLYYSDDKVKEKCKGHSERTLDAIKSVMTNLAKKYPEDNYADGGMMANGGLINYDLYENKSMEYVEGEIAHTERSARKFRQIGDDESAEDREKHAKKLWEIYYKKRSESKMADGGMMAKGGYNYGRSWHLDRARHNNSEDWEVRRRGSFFEKGGATKEPYTYIPNRNVEELMVILNGQSVNLKGSDILDGVYAKNSALAKLKAKKAAKVKVSSTSSKLSVDEAYKKLLEKAKDMGETDLESLRKNDVKKLVNAGFEMKDLEVVYFGVRSLIPKIDISYGSGLLKYRVEYLDRNVNRYVNSMKKNQFEIGLKYPDFSWNKIIDKYKISKDPVLVEGETIDFKSSKENYVYAIYKGNKVVLGTSVDRNVYKDGVKQPSDPYYKTEPITNGKFEGGYWGIVTSSKEIMYDIASMIISQKSGYVKDMELFKNGLGGVSTDDLTRNDVEFARGGYNYGRSWHLDRARHNNSEDWEVRRRGSYEEGGQIDIDSFAEGGELAKTYLVTFDSQTDEYQPTTFKATSMFELIKMIRTSVPEDVEILSIEEMTPYDNMEYGGVSGY